MGVRYETPELSAVPMHEIATGDNETTPRRVLFLRCEPTLADTLFKLADTLFKNE